MFACVNLPIKSGSSLLAPAHPGGPGKRTIKQLWWWVTYLLTGQVAGNTGGKLGNLMWSGNLAR